MDSNVSRRKFLGGIIAIPTLAALGAPLAAVGQYVYPPDSLLQPPAPKKIGTLAELKPMEALRFDYNDIPCMAVKIKDQVIAYTLKCTHLGCTVDVPKGSLEGKKLICPCHGGEFDPEGTNIGGPPPKPLVRLAVEVKENGDIIVKEGAV
ncbi:rieske iron sulfur protein subunit of cytochrome bc complex petc [Heliomicrobium modesticaldum Ice1]|uniref:Rieske iron sulfur protein subunit of cytochrome bc complex petc n=1 Tax=Heliobacterium modesticaldum (strain ATCC 51547 / Ice1) TaxID=498761 RepID=B0TBL4_HELMI|nr:Rieske (2Fe-2S) protein [Heliomicrobium modesticaldum]ABZ83853.1 rieske iron sulfur protein subunit of cytochrome bc complex petc [Heliomicrobium modesticaldum Ice1]